MFRQRAWKWVFRLFATLTGALAIAYILSSFLQLSYLRTTGSALYIWSIERGGLVVYLIESDDREHTQLHFRTRWDSIYDQHPWQQYWWFRLTRDPYASGWVVPLWFPLF